MANNPNAPHIDILRSPLGRARGLGAAKSGAGDWWVTRINSAALVPLSLWFVFSVIHLAGAPHEAVVAWLSSPWVLVLMLILIATTFHHMELGLRNVIDDYIHHDGTKLAAVLANKAVCILLALLCIVSVLKIGL